jgi:hypothetical protein
MKRLMQFGVLAALMAFGMVCTASADIIITPDSTDLVVATGNQTGVGGPNGINQAVLDSLGFSLADNEVYKQDVGDSDVGALADSYNTSFNGDLSGGSITYVGGPFLGNPIYLLVKDGDQIPAWYLFDIQDWNGTETITLSGFWPDNGSISHVSIYGDNIQVPEPSSLLLLGSGILAFGFAGRRWFKS